MRRSRRTQGGATPKNFDRWTAQARSMARKNMREETNADQPRRRSKRHSVVAATSTKNLEEMLKEAERLARESIYAEACAKKIKHKGPPFRLLDLPPDIRMRIYEYMVFRPYLLHLRNLVASLITAVNKQIRAECMASFFALNTFQVIVKTNICLTEHIDSFYDIFGSLRAARQAHNLTEDGRCWIDVLHRVAPRAGAIQMLPSTGEWLDKISDKVAVFRNIYVVLNDTFNHPIFCASNTIEPRPTPLIWTLKRSNPRAGNAITVRLWHPNQLVPRFADSPMDDSTEDDFNEMPYQAVKGILNGDDPMFRTFNLDALECLAYSIGHWGDFS